MKWQTLNNLPLKKDQRIVINNRESRPENHSIAKKILGIDQNTELRNFNFEISIFGILSECFLEVECAYEKNSSEKILEAGKTMPVHLAFKDPAQEDEILNLFDDESAEKPNFLMLLEFIKSNLKFLKHLSHSEHDFWISKWSTVNNWAIYWRAGDTFNCLSKMIG